MLDKKTFGQYFTKKDLWLKPQIKKFIEDSKCKIVYDPFAGEGDLLKISDEYGIEECVGLDIDDKYVIYNLSTLKNFNFIKFIEDYNESLALSSGIFLGVGGYNCEPVQISLLISNIEMTLGVITMGVGIGAFVRKIIR